MLTERTEINDLRPGDFIVFFGDSVNMVTAIDVTTPLLGPTVTKVTFLGGDGETWCHWTCIEEYFDATVR